MGQWVALDRHRAPGLNLDRKKQHFTCRQYEEKNKSISALLPKGIKHGMKECPISILNYKLPLE